MIDVQSLSKSYEFHVMHLKVRFLYLFCLHVIWNCAYPSRDSGKDLTVVADVKVLL